MMKKIILTFSLFTVLGTLVWAQEVDPSCGCPYTKLTRRYVVEEEIALTVDVPASFKGGNAALRRYEQRLIQNPAQNAADSAKYNILCRFKVDKKGKISDIELKYESDSTYANEARRFVETMPRWVSAQKDSIAVSSWHMMRLYFGQPGSNAPIMARATVHTTDTSVAIPAETAQLNSTKQNNIINTLSSNE